MRACLSVTALAVSLVATIGAQGPQKETIEGVRNFTRVDATVGCAGATEVKAIPELAKRGFKAIVNLRAATEAGAAIEQSRAAAQAAGMKFIHLPFDGSKPDPHVVDQFLAAVTDRTNQPVYINCGSANRVGGVWMAKRMVVDGWTEERAAEEAAAIGLRDPALRAFVVEYAKRKKG
jgi:uncharacterized protein (TIGR01244 family)